MTLLDVLQNNTILSVEKIIGDEAILIEPIPGVASKENLAFLENMNVEPVGQIYAFIKDGDGNIKLVLSLKGRTKLRAIRIETPEEAQKRDAKIKAKLEALEQK